MDTLIKTSFTESPVKTEKVKTTKTSIASAVLEFLDDLETNRFGVAPMLLALMVCLGGVAAAFAVQESQIELMAVALSTVLIEILVIALAPMRIIAVASVIAFVIDLFVLIF